MKYVVTKGKMRQIRGNFKEYGKKEIEDLHCCVDLQLDDTDVLGTTWS